MPDNAANSPVNPGPQSGTGPSAELFAAVGFGSADALALQALASKALAPVQEAAGLFAREAARHVAGGSAADQTQALQRHAGDWLARLLGRPTEQGFRQAARWLEELARDAGTPLPLIVAATGRLHLALEAVARQVFPDNPQRLRQALDAVGKTMTLLLAMLQQVTQEPTGPAGSGAAERLEPQEVYQQPLARALLDSAPLGIMAYDLYGRISVCNARLLEILGYNVESGTELRQWANRAVDDPEDRQEVELHFAAVFASEVDEEPSQARIHIRRPDGTERIVSLSSAAIRSLSGKRMGGVTIVADVTQQQQLEQNLIRAERLAAIGELAASLAHEIKNPLAGIGGAVEIIQGRFEEGDPIREVIDEILHQIKRLDSTVRDLLVYARPTPPERQPVDVTSLIDAVLTVLARERQLQPLQIIKHYPDEPVAIDADPNQLEQLCMNIVLNAAQAMAGPGRLIVRVQPEPGRCVIVFMDNGPGMDPEVARRAFEPFFTTKSRGTGLGLSICRKIVEAHGGRIQMETVPGQGTTVTVTLPR